MKDQALALFKEQTRFYLSTPEKVAEALLFVRSAEKYIKELKSKVKERAVEVMDRESAEIVTYRVVDPETGEVNDYQVRRDYSKQSKEYQPANVIAALGLEKALPFLSVKKTDLEKYLKLETAKGNLPMETLEAALKDPVIKTIAGSGVKITEVKA